MSEKTGTMQVTVEMSDQFEPGERTAAALAALVEAIEEEHGDDDDVAGFSASAAPLRTFTLAVTTGPSTSWTFENGWPSKWHDISLDGKGTDV